MKRRLLGAILVVLMLATALAGCAMGGAKESAGETTQGSSGQTDSGGAPQPVEIDYTCMFSEGEPHAAWLSEVAKLYEAETGNKVNITFVGRDVLTKIKSRILTDDAPDLVDHDCSELTAALLSGEELLALPLDDLLNAPGYDGEASLRDAFNSGILDMYNIDGSSYVVPYIYITSGFFYNKTLFEQMGVTAPATWSEFIQLGETFKSQNLPLIAHDGGISFYNAYYYYWACQRVMGQGKFLEAATDTTGAAWDDPGYLKAAELVYELSKGGKDFFVPGYEGSAYPAGQADWALGNAGVNLNGTWLPNEVKDIIDPDWEWGYFPFPTVEGGVGKITDMEAYLIGWAIPKGAKHPEEAQDFIRFAVSKANAERMVEVTMNISSRLEIPYPGVLAEVEKYLKNADSFFLSYDGVMSKAPQWWADIFYDLDNALFFGTITPEQFISQIKAKTIEFYANKTS